MLDDLATDVQTEAAALRLSGQRVARLAKLVEDDPLVRRVDAWTVVAHLHPKGARLRLQGDADLASPGLAEFRRVRQQVQHHLDDAIDVGTHRGHLLRQLDVDLDRLLLEDLAHAGDRVADQLAHIDAGFLPLGLAGLDLREVQHLVDEPRQALGFLGNDAEEFRALLGVHVGVLEQDLREGADRSERRAQLVAYRRYEVVLHPVELLQLLVRRAQLGSGRLELVRLLLEPVAIDHHL